MIPLVDLKLQYQSLKHKILPEIDRLLTEAQLIGGEPVLHFEEAFAKFCGVKHAIAVSNGTEALYLSLLAMGVGPDDEVILPTHTFIATSEAVRLLGAKAVFADINETTFTIDPAQVKKQISKRTKVILPVHLYGFSADIDGLSELIAGTKIEILCDAAQAHGATYKGVPVSNFGKTSTFSFYPGKNLGAYGDAGAITTNDSHFATTVGKMRDHGRSQKYQHDIIGTNGRMDTIQAAILRIKLNYLTQWVAARQAHANYYQTQLSKIKQVHCPFLGDTLNQHAMHLYVIRVNKKDRDALLSHLNAHHIGAGIHYPIPLHLQPCNADLGYQKGDFPVAEQIASEIISLPLYPELTHEQMDTVISAVEVFYA